MTEHRKYLHMMVICSILFGFCGFIKVHLPMPPGLLAMLRGFIASAFIFLVAKVTGKKVDFKGIRENLWKLLLSALTLSANWILLFYAYDLIGTATVGLLNYIAPLIVIFLSPILFGEKIKGIRWLFIGMAIVGIVMVSGIFDGDIRFGESGSDTALGILLSLLAALSFAVMIIVNKKMKNIDGFSSGIAQMLFEGTIAGIYFLAVEKAPVSADLFRGENLWWLLASTVGTTGITYALYFTAMQHLKAQSVSLLSYVDPVVSTTVAFTLLGEQVTVFKIVGAVLLLGGVLMAEWRA